MDLRICLIVILLSLSTSAQSALSGIWKGDKGGTFYIQESRGKIYWYAEQLSRNPYWAHVFNGKLKDREIKGTWIDIPKGKRRSQGRLIAEVTPDGKNIIFKGAGFDAERLYRWVNKPVSAESDVVITRPPVLEEKCISLNPTFSKVEFVQGRWVISDGGTILFDFDRNKTEADQALKIIKYYRMDSFCRLNQAESLMTYLLVNEQAPIGKMVEEDCIVFDPGRLKVKEVGDGWRLVDNNQWVFEFGDDIQAAKKSLELIRKYRFNRSCFVGRPEPSFQYLRQ